MEGKEQSKEMAVPTLLIGQTPEVIFELPRQKLRQE
jgi:hypothetical protein